jgi:UDP-2,3-diacylglucosamine hydrolase
MGRVIIVGDVHIGANGGQRHKSFSAFLDHVRLEKPQALLLAGDIFEFMYGGTKWNSKKYPDIFQKLNLIHKDGVKIYYVYGNHDFCFHPAFDFINISAGYEKIKIAGRNFCFKHGDGLDPNDKKYILLKKILRSKFFSLMAQITPDFVLYLLANFFSSLSRRVDHDPRVLEKRSMIYKEAALDLLNKGGLDVVAFGHTHVAEFCRIGHPGRIYLNPGFFGKDRTYAVIENDNSVYIGVFNE